MFTVHLQITIISICVLIGIYVTLFNTFVHTYGEEAFRPYYSRDIGT